MCSPLIPQFVFLFQTWAIILLLLYRKKWKPCQTPSHSSGAITHLRLAVDRREGLLELFCLVRRACVKLRSNCWCNFVKSGCSSLCSLKLANQELHGWGMLMEIFCLIKWFNYKKNGLEGHYIDRQMQKLLRPKFHKDTNFFTYLQPHYSVVKNQRRRKMAQWFS